MQRNGLIIVMLIVKEAVRWMLGRCGKDQADQEETPLTLTCMKLKWD